MSNDRNAKPPMPTDGDRVPAARSTHSEIDEFLSKVKELAPATRPGPRGRLLFALDATMSRQPLWDTACQLQAEMFREAAAIGGLDIQLVYYRGLSECRASQWVSRAERLAALMEQIDCRGGHTQIGKIIAHARRETQKAKVQALVSSGMRWRRSSTTSARRPVRSGFSGCLPSCSRKAAIRLRNRLFARSRVSQAAPIADSIRAPLINWPSFCARWQPMRRAACARSPISRPGMEMQARSGFLSR